MLRFYWSHHYLYDGNEDCVYCHRKTQMHGTMTLPNFNFRVGKWHTNCVAKFISENIDRFEDNQEIDRYVDQGETSKAIATVIYKIGSDELKMRGSMPLTV
jgi:hypothetical protein